MEHQADASRYQSAVERVRAQQSSGDPLQSAAAPTPRCQHITNAEEISNTPTTRPAVRITRDAPEFFTSFDRV